VHGVGCRLREGQRDDWSWSHRDGHDERDEVREDDALHRAMMEIDRPRTLDEGRGHFEKHKRLDSVGPSHQRCRSLRPQADQSEYRARYLQ
jgi:hypothetical protein